MQLFYDGKVITDAVEINRADMTDTAGGAADSLELCMNDTAGVWSSWSPQKNDTILIKQDGFSSGNMYVDELEQQRGVFIIRALSLPQEAKTHRTKCWENVLFSVFAGEIAKKYGFELRSYGIDDYLYPRLDQHDQSDMEFLAFRCMLEGYMLKITDNQIIIYDERYMESQDAAKTIHLSDFDGPYQFKTKSTGIYSTCELRRNGIQSAYKSGTNGAALRISSIPINSQAEADRFSMNTLRYYNKQESTGKISIRLDTGITAGNTIRIAGVGIADGKYFCEQAIHRIVEKRTVLRLRKVLEGY